MPITIDGVSMSYEAAKKRYPALAMNTIMMFRDQSVPLSDLLVKQTAREAEARAAFLKRNNLSQAKQRLYAFMQSDKKEGRTSCAWRDINTRRTR